MSRASRPAAGPARQAQLSLVGDGTPAAPVPSPRPPQPGEHLRAVPELGAAGRELDRWRITGRDARVLTPFSATACTGNHGLCGVCTGGPCQHDLDHHQHASRDQAEQDQTEEEPELELEDEEPEP